MGVGQRFRRANRSVPGWLGLSKCGALAASVVASLAYPWAVGPRSAAAEPAAPQQADPPPSNPVAISIRLAEAETALVQSQGQLDDAAAQVRRQAVNAFVEGGSARTTNSWFQGNGYDGAVRNEYVTILTGNAQGSFDRLVRARADLQAEQARLQKELKWAQASVAQAVSTQGDGAVAVSNTSSTPSLAINNPQDFAVALLRALGDPVSSSNTQAIVAWCNREGGAWNSPSHFNPLNTSMRMPGSHSINGSAVQSYTSWSQGLVATVATLNSGAYRGILAALSAGSSVSAVESAVANSSWGTHF